MRPGTHKKVAIGWTIAIAVGLYSFVLSKRSIDAKRYRNMKAREQAQMANIEEY